MHGLTGLVIILSKQLMTDLCERTPHSASCFVWQALEAEEDRLWEEQMQVAFKAADQARAHYKELQEVRAASVPVMALPDILEQWRSLISFQSFTGSPAFW